MFTSKDLKNQIAALESEVDKQKAQISDFTELSASLESEKDKSASLEASLEAVKASLASASGDLATAKAEIVSLEASSEAAEKAKAQEIKDKAEAATVDLLSDAGADATITSAAAKEGLIADFESQYAASRKKGGAAHASFIRSHKSEIRDYRNSQ